MTVFRYKMGKRTCVALAVVLLVVSALATGRVAVGTVSDSSEDDTVVANAGDVSITARELQEDVMLLQHARESIEGELQRSGEYGAPTDHLIALHNLVIKWGVDNASLAGLIHERIIHQKATELGYEVTERELEENIEWARDAYERREPDAYTQGYIDSVGADHYWDNIYPELAARSMAINKLRNGVVEEVEIQDYVVVRPNWHDFTRQVIAAAEITVPASEDHSATLDGVMGFWDELRDINRAHLRKDDDLPAAVEETWVIYIERADSGMWETIHHNIEQEVCTGKAESGNETHHICDFNGEVLAELGQGDAAFVITPSGETLPIFSK